MDVTTILDLYLWCFRNSFNPEFFHVYDKVMAAAFAGYDLDWNEFNQEPLDQENSRLFLEVCIKIFNSLVKNAETEAARASIAGSAAVVLKKVIHYADAAEANLLPQEEELNFGEVYEPVRISLNSTLQTSHIQIDLTKVS